MSVLKDGVSPEIFYGGKNVRQEKIEAILKKKNDGKEHQRPKFMDRLLGPSRTWKIFKKQQDAINDCLHRGNGLMPFAFEDINMRRMFLVAHPKVFWTFNCHRFFKSCSSYEIIREHSACKLYLDIEFEYAYNKNKNGGRMLNNIMEVISINLKNHFNISCTPNDILDLDSSSECKFSHHVIYEIKNVAFQDNYAVGNFIKSICGEIRSAFENNLSGDRKKLEEVADKYCLLQNDILELFITDRKGQTKLLLDEGVYTKNRHFRLLGSSKKTKNVPLEISDVNKYKPEGGANSLDYFLDSLITYFSWKVERILEFVGFKALKPPRHRHPKEPRQQSARKESLVHFQIDSFINSLILPMGRIRRKVFFGDSSTIVYDIQGFRFCDNIKREHKSNNIKYIVDLERLGYYQKCHDPDCADFRSDMKRLPDEICFFFEDDPLQGFSEQMDKAVLEEKHNESSFDSTFDQYLEEVANFAEAVMEVEW